MKVINKLQSKSCCGTKNLTLILDSSFSISLAKFLSDNKFFVTETMVKNGYLYAKINGLIVTGIFGSAQLKINCQGPGCEFQVQNLISLLEKYET